MGARRTLFRQSDVTRALRAAKAAGLVVIGYMIEADGKIVVNTANSAPSNPGAPLDKWMAEHASAS